MISIRPLPKPHKNHDAAFQSWTNYHHIIGAWVTTKASSIGNQAEFYWYYGSAKIENILVGRVHSNVNKSTQTEILIWFLKCVFKLSTCVSKETKFIICYVDRVPWTEWVGEPPSTPLPIEDIPLINFQSVSSPQSTPRNTLWTPKTCLSLYNLQMIKHNCHPRHNWPQMIILTLKMGFCGKQIE